MSLYLDASVLVALFTADALSARASARMRDLTEELVVSDFAALEFASAVARMARIKALSPAQARAALADFDAWIPRATRWAETTPGDVGVADAYIRRLDLNLRGPDALNLAITFREGAALLTFDAKMGTAAKKLGVALA